MTGFAKTRRFFHRVVLAKQFTWIYDRFQLKQPLGARGEIQAERFFLRLGWIIIHRNFSTDLGEVDLIAVDQDTLVFVEVKTRRNCVRGRPEDSVDEEKIRRIARMAEQFLRRHQLNNYRVRFDLVSIIWPQDSVPEIEHYRNAFQAPTQIGS